MWIWVCARIRELDSLRWFSQRRSPMPHSWGVGCAPGGNSNSVEIFVRCTYPPSFIILCLLVRKLSCWQTHKQTHKPIHKQTDSAAKTSNVLGYAIQRWVTRRETNKTQRKHRKVLLLRRSRSAAAYSDQTFPWTICRSVRRSVCPVRCGKTAERIRMPFGIIGRTGPEMRKVVGFVDRSTGRNTFGGEFGARHCNQWGRHCNQWGLYGVRVRQCRDAALFPNYFGQTCLSICHTVYRRKMFWHVFECGQPWCLLAIGWKFVPRPLSRIKVHVRGTGAVLNPKLWGGWTQSSGETQKHTHSAYMTGNLRPSDMTQ